MAVFTLFIGVQFSLGYSDASAQSSTSQVTGNEFTPAGPRGISDSQSIPLWNAYKTKSDSLLAKFFNNWRLETQIVEEPMLDTPINNSIASLYLYLMNSDFQNSVYPYKYAVIQNEIEATVESSASSSQEDYTLYDFHPQSSDPNHPILIMLDDKRDEMLSEFLGDWSVAKAEAAQQFFGSYVPFGADVDYSAKQADWSLIRHWYSFAFTSDLQEALVSDETPSGTEKYTCVIGQDGNWMKVSDQTIVLDQTQSPEQPIEPVPVPYPMPTPYPIHHPRPPRPHYPPVASPVTITPAPSPTPAPPVGRPRPIGTTRPNDPSNPVNVGRPRPVMPTQPLPQTPAQPSRPRTNLPVAPQPTPPQTPVERPRTVQPAPSNPTPQSSAPTNPQRSSPPPEKNTQDQKKGR